MALASVCGFNKTDFLKQNSLIEFDCFSRCDNLENPLQLAVPPYANPAQSLAKLQENGEKSGIKINFDHGTTTLGFEFQGGVVLAVDSRATGGQYIGSQTMKKVVEINDFLLGTLAGGAADCVYWDRVLARECRLHELRNRERISVAAASKIMSNIANYYKGMGLSMGMMLAGYDNSGASLYYIDSSGSRTKGKLFSVGSGSLYAYGVLDSGYRYDLTNEEAYELGRRAIYHATHRDAYSGGIVRVYHMTPNGKKHISDEDCMDLHYKYAEEKMN
jgi:20S proteasome subunit beta 5